MRRSQGKARPSLPRAKELRPIDTAAQRTDDRGATGRFRPGNRAAKNKGAKAVLNKATSPDGLAADEATVARDTRKLLLSTLREVAAGDSTIVRAIAYSFARESSLAAFYDSAANRKGLATPEGMRFVERASFHRQRAERLSVTLLAEAKALASAKPSAPDFAALIAASSRTDAPPDEPENEPGVEEPERDELATEPTDDEPNPGLVESPRPVAAVKPHLRWVTLPGGAGQWLYPGDLDPTTPNEGKT